MTTLSNADVGAIAAMSHENPTPYSPKSPDATNPVVSVANNTPPMLLRQNLTFAPCGNAATPSLRTTALTKRSVFVALTDRTFRSDRSGNPTSGRQTSSLLVRSQSSNWLAQSISAVNAMFVMPCSTYHGTANVTVECGGMFVVAIHNNRLYPPSPNHSLKSMFVASSEP